jgi:uncharacterized membrane-anchored protein
MKFWLLLAVIVVQVAVLIGEYLGAVYPLWTGQEVKLKTVPVDPRSLFRGNYARLRYDIARIETEQDLPIARRDEVVYVALEAGEKSWHHMGISLQPPDSGVFLRGRLQGKYPQAKGKFEYRIAYHNIEAYFAPREKAVALEQDLLHGGLAVLMVASNGKATLKAVIPDESQRNE